MQNWMFWSVRHSLHALHQNAYTHVPVHYVRSISTVLLEYINLYNLDWNDWHYVYKKCILLAFTCKVQCSLTLLQFLMWELPAPRMIQQPADDNMSIVMVWLTKWRKYQHQINLVHHYHFPQVCNYSELLLPKSFVVCFIIICVSYVVMLTTIC